MRKLILKQPMYIIDKYGLERERVLTIGDREIDIEAGKKAGIATCLFNPDKDFVKTSGLRHNLFKSGSFCPQVCNRFMAVKAMIENLIWDFDGSLFNTYPAMVRLFKQSLAIHGCSASEDEILSLIKKRWERP